MVLGAIAVIAAAHVALWAWNNKLGIEAYTRVSTMYKREPTPRLCHALPAEPVRNYPPVISAEEWVRELRGLLATQRETLDRMETNRTGEHSPVRGTINAQLSSAILGMNSGSRTLHPEPAPISTVRAELLAALNTGRHEPNDPFYNLTAVARAESTHGSMPGLVPGTPDTIEEPHPPEEPIAMSDEEESSVHDEDTFISRETPGDVQLFRRMALLCGEVLGELTAEESVRIIENSMSDARLFKEQHHLNSYQENTFYSLLCITSACRLGREPNPERFARFAVWLQHARLLIDSRERFNRHRGTA